MKHALNNSYFDRFWMIIAVRMVREKRLKKRRGENDPFFRDQLFFAIFSLISIPKKSKYA